MKHAYLIIANRNPSQLQKLLTMIDDSRNDIYLLIDKKSVNYPKKFYTNYSIINYVTPINIYWGSYSQIKAELNLFKASAPEHYTYYHLLSGLDLPLDNQDNIHKFFDDNLNKEFISYGSFNKSISSRIKHHFFRKHFRDNHILCKIYRKCENEILKFTPLLKIKQCDIGYASNWVSIDDNLVQLIIRNCNIIHYLFKYGYLVDELFIPTMLNFYPNVRKRVYYKKPMHNIPNEFQGNLRYINWWDGHPYVWRLKDYNTLIKARKLNHLFSRKFDERIDYKIINKLFVHVMNS